MLPEPGAGPTAVAGLDVKNFGVVDERMLRGAQPKGQDYASLAAVGVTTVIDLREDAKAESRANAESAGLTYVNIPMKGSGGTPTDEQVRRFIAAVDVVRDGRVYVHCAGGRHRTGSMIAIYRMTHQGWSVDQAYAEMLAYDFYTSFGHSGFKTYVFDYSRRLATDPAAVPVGIHALHST